MAEPSKRPIDSDAQPDLEHLDKDHPLKRVHERNAIADEFSADQKPIPRAVGKAKLGVGNLIDLAYSAITRPSVQGAAGAAIGLFRGIFFGIVAVAVLSIAAPALGAAVIGAIALATVVGVTGYETVKSYNSALIKTGRGSDIANTMGKNAGVLPAVSPSPAVSAAPEQAGPAAGTEWRDRVGGAQGQSPGTWQERTQARAGSSLAELG